MKNMTLEDSNSVSSPWRRLRQVVFLSLLVAGTVAAWVCREPLRHLILTKGVMLNNAPTEEAMKEVIESAKDKPAAIRALWNTQKILQRETAIRQFSHHIPAGEPIPAQWETWVLAAALDPDMDVRETAMGILREHKHPDLAAICVAQFKDEDPEARQLGLDNFRGSPAAVGVPAVIPLLNDPDPRIIATALKLLEKWTGHDFGVKLADTVPSENQETGLLEYHQKSNAKAEAGAARAKMWWAEHQTEFMPTHLEAPPQVLAALQPVPAGDFSLPTLDGRQVKLSDFRGKVILINFWTTWCTACLGEMPALIELQKSDHAQVIVLGVSLDFMPDDDHSQPEGQPSLNEIRGKVARAVKARGINYTVLLDEKNNAGSRFNGGELPTTVIVDAAGYVRRRFIGARSLPVFEAMIAEAGRPLRQTRQPAEP
jgi:thiol-disulfide isomerase/thioredoxin